MAPYKELGRKTRDFAKGVQRRVSRACDRAAGKDDRQGDSSRPRRRPSDTRETRARPLRPSSRARRIEEQQSEDGSDCNVVSLTLKHYIRPIFDPKHRVRKLRANLGALKRLHRPPKNIPYEKLVYEKLNGCLTQLTDGIAVCRRRKDDRMYQASRYEPGVVFSAPHLTPDKQNFVELGDTTRAVTCVGTVRTKYRKFVVVQRYQQHCNCVPIYTSGGTGLDRKQRSIHEWVSIRDGEEVRSYTAKPPRASTPSCSARRTRNSPASSSPAGLMFTWLRPTPIDMTAWRD